MAGVTRAEDRPISPFVSVWRWHITMLSSILHRATGVALYAAGIGMTIGSVFGRIAGAEAAAHARN